MCGELQRILGCSLSSDLTRDLTLHRSCYSLSCDALCPNDLILTRLLRRSCVMSYSISRAAHCPSDMTVDPTLYRSCAELSYNLLCAAPCTSDLTRDLTHHR